MDGLNHYTYANSNPIKYSDPTGLSYEGEDYSSHYAGRSNGSTSATPLNDDDDDINNSTNNSGGNNNGDNHLYPKGYNPNNTNNTNNINVNNDDKNLWDTYLEYRENNTKKDQEQFENDLKKYQEWEERFNEKNLKEKLLSIFTDPRPKNPLFVMGYPPPLGIKGGIQAVLRAEKGIKAIKTINASQAINRLQKGKDVYAGSRSAAKSLMQRASHHHKVIQEVHKGKGFFTHFHDIARNLGHVFFGGPH